LEFAQAGSEAEFSFFAMPRTQRRAIGEKNQFKCGNSHGSESTRPLGSSLMPDRPHVAALFPGRSPGLDKSMNSDLERQYPAYPAPRAARLRGGTAEFLPFTD